MEARSTSARSGPLNRSPFRNRDRHRLADARWRANLSECYSTLSHVIDRQRKRISKIQILKKTRHHLEMLECTLRDLLHLKAERIGYHERSTLPRGFAFEDFLNDFLSTETFILCQNFSLIPTSGVMEMYKSALKRENRLHSVSITELSPTQSFSSLREILFEATKDDQTELQPPCDPEKTRLEEYSFGAAEDGVVPQGPPDTPSTSREPCRAPGNPRGKASRRKGCPRILGRTVRRRLLDEEVNNVRNYVPNLETSVERNEDASRPDGGYILCSPFTRLLPAQEYRIEEPESFYYTEEPCFSCKDTTGPSLEQNWIREPVVTSLPVPSPRGRQLHIVWLNREDATAESSRRNDDQIVPVGPEPGTPYATLQEVSAQPGFPSPPLTGDLDLGEEFNLSAYMNWCENLEPNQKHMEYEALWDSFHQ